LLSAAGKPIPAFGLHLPALVPVSEPLADWLKPRHTTGGTLGYYLIGLHTAAALWHHNWIRDNTLRRLLPRRASRALNVPDEPGHFAPVAASPTNRQHKPKPHALERKPALGGPVWRLLRRRGFV
jgi:hypothetical protein